MSFFCGREKEYSLTRFEFGKEYYSTCFDFGISLSVLNPGIAFGWIRLVHFLDLDTISAHDKEHIRRTAPDSKCDSRILCPIEPKPNRDWGVLREYCTDETKSLKGKWNRHSF